MPYDLMSFFYSPQVEAQKAQMGKIQVQEAQMQLEDQKRLRDARQSMDLSELSNYVDESSTPELKAALTDFAIAQKSGVPSAIKDAETQVANIRQKTAMSQKEGIDAQMKQLDFVGRQISYFKDNPSPDSLNTVVYNLMKANPQQAQQTVQALAKMGIQPNPITNRYDNIPPQSMGALKQYVDAQERLGLSAKEKFEQQYKMLDLQERTNQRKEDRAARVEHWKAIEQQRSGMDEKITPAEKNAAFVMTTEVQSAAKDIKNLMELTGGGDNPLTSSAFINLSDHGLLGATSKQLTQSLTDEDRQMYSSLMQSLIRETAIAKNPRYKITEGAAKQQAEEILSRAGTTHATALYQIALMKQGLDSDVEAAIASNIFNPQQKKLMEAALEQNSRMISFDPSDVLAFSKRPDSSLKFTDFLKKRKETSSEKEINFTPDSGWKPTSQSQISAMDKAMQAIANGTDREAVINRLREHGIMVK